MSSLREVSIKGVLMLCDIREDFWDKEKQLDTVGEIVRHF
jgi:hypothetical protein